MKVEQQNLKNCLEKQPSSRSILEPLLELLCKADRDKVNELEKKLEDQKKIVDISGREYAQLALNMSVCQKQLMNLSDSLQSALFKSDEMKQNSEASLREIQNKVSNCEVDLIKTGETVESSKNVVGNLTEKLETSRREAYSTMEQLKTCSQTKQELNDNLQEKVKVCTKEKENSDALVKNLQDDQNTARKEQAKLRTDMAIYQDAIMNCMKNTLNTNPGAKVDAIIKCMTTTFSSKIYPGATIYSQYAVDRLGSPSIPNVKPLKSELGPVYNDITSFQYPISIPSCPEVNGRRNIFIAVFSVPGDFDQRTRIRQSWAKDLKNAWNQSLTGFAGLAFILGQTQDSSVQKRIEEENTTHKDIIKIDMTINDAFRNWSTKLAGFLNWMYKNCASFKGFILRVDDSAFVNVRTLEYFIHENDPFTPSIFGTKLLNQSPDRGRGPLIDDLSFSLYQHVSY